MGLIDYKPTVDTSDIKETGEEIDNLHKKAEKPVKIKTEVESEQNRDTSAYYSSIEPLSRRVQSEHQ